MNENKDINGLYKMKGLTEYELKRIKELEDICSSYEGLQMKLNWGSLSQRPTNEMNDLMYFQNGRLAGYLGLHGFNSIETELTGMVHPEFRRKGIFLRLVEAAKEECRKRGNARVLLICEQASAPGAAFIKDLGAQLSHSEYRMELRQGEETTDIPQQEIEIRRVTVEDIEVVSRVDALCFDQSEEGCRQFYMEEAKNPKGGVFVVSLGGKAIGKIGTLKEQDSRLIFGFGILPEYRGKGYGRVALMKTVAELLAGRPQKIELEVVCENKKALNLYKSSGFKEATAYDYYRLDL